LTEIRSGHTKFPDERLAIERHLSLVEARLRHLVEAVATGRSTDAIFDELGKEEAAKKTLAAQLASLTQRASLTSLDGKRIERSLVERVADVKGLLGRHVPQTRQMLRKLISGRIQCAPFDTRGRGYNLAATGTYAGLLSEKMLVKDGGGGHPIPALFCPTIRVPLRVTKVGCGGPQPQFFTPPHGSSCYRLKRRRATQRDGL
jgi:hypothetical protein